MYEDIGLQRPKKQLELPAIHFPSIRLQTMNEKRNEIRKSAGDENGITAFGQDFDKQTAIQGARR